MSDRALYTVLITMFAGLFFATGVFFEKNTRFVSSNHPIEPTVTIRCEDSKCDTTYTYKNPK